MICPSPVLSGREHSHQISKQTDTVGKADTRRDMPLSQSSLQTDEDSSSFDSHSTAPASSDSSPSPDSSSYSPHWLLCADPRYNKSVRFLLLDDNDTPRLQQTYHIFMPTDPARVVSTLSNAASKWDKTHLDMLNAHYEPTETSTFEFLSMDISPDLSRRIPISGFY